MSVIVIKVEGVDITSDVMLAEATFTSSVGSLAGEFDIKVKDPTAAYDFKATQNITLDIDSSRVFDGYLMHVSQQFAFPALDTSKPQVLIWHLRGPDVNILFQKKVVHKVSNPRQVIPQFPIGTTDLTALNALIANYLDLTGESLTTDFTQVGTVDPYETTTPYASGNTWLTAMNMISQVPGAVWGIRPDRTIYYEDDDTEDAPFRLSDTPNDTTSFGYADLEWTDNATNMVNDALVWGAGIGSSERVYKRTQDATSIAAHGRWQTGNMRGSVFRQTTVNIISNSIVYGSPQNLHGAKDPQVIITCRVRQPGLLPGHKVHITSNVYGISGIYPIRRLTMTFPNPEAVLYDLQLSWDIDRPLSYHNWLGVPEIGDPPPPPPPVWPEPRCVYVDTFDERTVDPQGWGRPSRGEPNWAIVSQTFGEDGGVSHDLSVYDGYGHSHLQLTNSDADVLSSYSTTNRAANQIKIEIPEITDWDEFVISFDLVFSALFFTPMNQAITWAEIYLGGVPLNALEVRLYFFSYSASGANLNWLFTRDLIGGGGTGPPNGEYPEPNGEIATTNAFDTRVIIDRSVRRNSTLITIGSFGTYEISPIGPASSNLEPYMYVTHYATAWTFGGETVPTNHLSIDDIVVCRGAIDTRNVLDDFNGRTLPDNHPLLYSGAGGGSWGIASCGTEWTGGISNLNSWIGVGSSVGGNLNVGVFTREQRPQYPDPGAPGMNTGGVDTTLYPCPAPLDDEPVLTFKFRAPAIIPDDSTTLSGSKGPLKILIKWQTDGSERSLEFVVAVSSVAGKGGLALGSNNGAPLAGLTTYAKTNWTGGAMYQVEAQYLHDGTQRVRVWRPDTESRPDWQIDYLTPYGDYGSWSGDGFFNLRVVTYNNDEVTLGNLESFRVEFEDIVMGSRTPMASSAPATPTIGAYGCEQPTRGAYYLYEVSHPYIAGTLEVYVNGTRQRAGVDYYEVGSNSFYMTIPGGEVTACYRAQG